MTHIQLPEILPTLQHDINREELKAIFEEGGKYPSIKEKLILKAHEITDHTKLVYDSKELAVLCSNDSTGVYLSCFNKTEEEIKLEVPLTALELSGKHSAYCVLTAEELIVLDERLTLFIPDLGILLVKLTKQS